MFGLCLLLWDKCSFSFFVGCLCRSLGERKEKEKERQHYGTLRVLHLRKGRGRGRTPYTVKESRECKNGKNQKEEEQKTGCGTNQPKNKIKNLLEKSKHQQKNTHRAPTIVLFPSIAYISSSP